MWGVIRFLRSLFDESFLAHAHVSAGFHYPVRTQYATLHMQVRVNSGSVCREDGRGIETTALIENMKRDRLAYLRDEDTQKYLVTENVKVSLLAAANEFEEQNPGSGCQRQTTPLNYELGLTTMPTIQDQDDEEEGEEEARGVGSRESSRDKRGALSVDVAAEAAAGSSIVRVPGSPEGLKGGWRMAEPKLGMVITIAIPRLGMVIVVTIITNWGMFRTCLGHVWDMFGTCLGHVWGMFGACLGHVWDMFGGHVWDTCLGHVWGMFGTCLGHVWGMFGTCLGHVWDMFGTCLGHVWDMFGTCLGHGGGGESKNPKCSKFK